MKHIKRLHQSLEENLSWYRKWHEHKSHRAVHYGLLLISIIFAVSMIISSSQTFAATTYYVSTTGNDSNPGTQASPWKTLVKACNTASAQGDIIHVVAGTYTESAICNLAPGVSIVGEGKTTTIIKSSRTGQWSNWIQMESPDNTNGNQSISNLTLDGQTNTTGNASGTWIGVQITGRSNVSIHDAIIKNFYAYGVIFQGNHLDGINATTWTSGPYATGNNFYNNEGANCAGVLAEIQGGSGCLGIGWQNGIEIYNNSIINNARPLGKNGWPIKFWSNGYLRGVKIHDNTLIRSPYNSPQVYGGTGEWDFAIEFFNVQGLELYNNYIQGSVDVNYIYKGTYPYGLWAHHNTLNHATQNPNPESGFIFEFKAEHVMVENSVLNNKFVGISYNTRGINNNGGENQYPCTGGGGGGGCSAIINNVIRNNVFSNLYPGNGASGGIITQSENTNDVQMDSMHIYNNVLSAKANGGTYNGIDFGGIGGGASLKNVYVRNNIFQNFQSNPIVAQSGGTQSNIQITNNDFYNNTPNTVSWAAATQANNQTINPMFVSATDFHLQASSPLIDDGFQPLVLPSYASPVPFNGNAPDLGAYETGTSAPDTTPPTVSNVSPANGSTGVAVSSDVIATFSEPLSSASVTTTTASIAGVTSVVTLSGNLVTINPSANLSPSTTYNVTLMGGASGIKDLAGNALVSNYTFSFTTAAPANIPPTANAGAPQTITLPTNSVNLSGSLSNDPDGTIVSYVWSKVSGSGTMNPTNGNGMNISVTGLTVGPSVYRLTVTDNQGATGVATVTITVVTAPDTTPPTVSITNPTNGQTVDHTVLISVNTADNVGVDHVDFYRGGTTLIGSSGVAPFSFNWNTTTVPNGTYSLTAKAYDAANNSTTSTPVSVSVLNTIDPGPDTTPPTVSITSPTTGQTVSSVATIKANATDNIGVTKVEFYRGGNTLIATDTTSPYEVTWDTTTVPNGTYSLTAKAYDGATPSPNTATSTAVSVTVNNVVVPPPNGTYTTWNPNDKGSNIMLSNGNLTEKDNGYKGLVRAKVGKSSGKWYWEIKVDDRGANQDLNLYPGVANMSAPKNNFVGYNKNSWGYWGAYGDKRNGKIIPYGPTFDEGDVIGVALDMDAKKLKYYKNCTDLGIAFSGLSGTMYPAVGQFGGDVQTTANFGATPFACPVPAGYNSGVY